MIHFVVRGSARWGIEAYLSSWGEPIADRIDTLTYEGLPSIRKLAFGTYVFTQRDDLLPRELEIATSIGDQLRQRGGVRLVNHPARTLGRYDLLRSLSHQGSNDFRAFRATEGLAGLRFPVFVREERYHTGSLTGLLQTHQELDEALGKLLFRGWRRRDLLVVEFCDTRDDEGLYRRYSAFVVGNEIIPRSVLFSTHWMVKGATKVLDEKRARQEFGFVDENPHAPWLKGIFELADIEYGRVDYGFRGERPQVWEINLHPTLVAPLNHQSSHLTRDEALRRPSRKLFFERFEAALEKIDVDTGGRGSVSISIGETLVRGLRSDRRRERIRALHRTMAQRVEGWRAVQPLWRILRPLASKLAAPVARWTRP